MAVVSLAWPCNVLSSHCTSSRPRSPLSSNSSCCLQLILCSWQTALCLRTGCRDGSIDFRLSSPFSASTPPGTWQRGPSRISHSFSTPAGPMRAPDSRPSISVSPAAIISAAYGTVCGNILCPHRATAFKLLPVWTLFAPGGKPFGIRTASVPRQLTSPATPWAPLSSQSWTT